jgi:hypothetical protein
MIEHPKKIAICFMSYDKDIAEKQSEDLSNGLNFETEKYYRYQKNPHQYQTFSQMINEAIDDTESEFMVFVNPKTVVSPEGLNFIIDKLCSGYCFASIFGFAYFGMTKELVRNIGMLDENFLGSEYEDDDYLIRMRIADKAVWWGQDWSTYNFFKSECPPNRGSSLTTFWRKWRWKNNTLISSNESKKIKYISNRHSSQNEEIRSSWKGFSESWGEGGIWGKIDSCRIQETDMSEFLVDSKIDIKISYDKNFFIEMISNVETAISYFIVKPNSKGRKPINMNLVYSNSWYSIPLDEEDEIELRLYHDGNLIYLNQVSKNTKFNMYLKIPSSILKNN